MELNKYKDWGNTYPNQPSKKQYWQYAKVNKRVTDREQEACFSIGAGPAGISFADKLVELSDEFCITILEKSQYIGGISKTVNFEGNRIDIGGHRFFSKSDEVMNWWAEKFPVSIEDDIQDIELKYQGNTKSQSLDGFRISK